MARKVLNRNALRVEAEAAEKAESAKKSEKKVAKSEGTNEKEKKPKRKSRKEPVVVRMKLFWGVYNQALRRVALYEFNQKKQAEKKAEDLSAGGKTPHFVAKVKEPITES